MTPRLRSSPLRASTPPTVRAARVTFVLFLFVIGGGFARALYELPPVIEIVFELVIAVLAGYAIVTPLLRRIAFMNGYDAARFEFFAGIDEAARRGMRPADWLRGEYEREMARLGIRLDDQP